MPTKTEKLSFASYYNDHMVLQQAPKMSVVWGYADITDVSQTVSIVLISNDGTHKSTYETIVLPGKESFHISRSAWVLNRSGLID